MNQKMNLSRESVEISVSRKKSFIVGCSAALLLCLIGGIILTRYQKMNNCYNDRPPLRSFAITIETSQSHQLKEQLQEFAYKNGFKHQTAYYSQRNENDFSVWMKRKDVEVVARSPFVRGEFEIGFYNNDCIHPTVATDIDNLVVDLKISLGEIPNAMITEEK